MLNNRAGRFCFFVFLTSVASVLNGKETANSDFSACWASLGYEQQRIVEIETAFDALIESIDAWPIGADNYRLLPVQCVKIVFEVDRVNNKVAYQVVSSTSRLFSQRVLQRLSQIDAEDVKLEEGMIIFHFVNPLLEEHLGKHCRENGGV